MVEFRSKRKQFEVSLGVTVDQPDGTEEKRILTFDCSPERYNWTVKVLELGEDLQRLSYDDILKSYKELYPKVRDGFELVAPGKFEEYFLFLGENILDTMQLLLLMIETITKKGVESKLEQIETAIPENAETI